MLCLILNQHTLRVFCVCWSLQMSQPLLNIWFEEQDWPLETSQIWHSFWSHANPQWEYLFSQNLCIIWHDTHFLFEVTHYMHNRHIACLHLWECLKQPVCQSRLLRWLSVPAATELSLAGHLGLSWERRCGGLQPAVHHTVPWKVTFSSWQASQNQANKSAFLG